MKRPPSIRTLLLGLCAALLLIVAAGELIFGAFFARAYFLGQKEAEMETFFQYIRENYTDSPQQLYELLREGEDVQNIRVAIYDQRGELIYTSRPMGAQYGGEPPFPMPDGAVSFSETPEVRELPTRSGEEDAQLGLTGKFSYEGEERYVLLWVMVASIESSIAAFNHVALYIVGVVLAAGILASVLFARRMIRPIRNIQRVSRQVADLDFSARADESVPVRELRDLAGSVNRMAEHLSAAVEELRRANERLQEDVDRQRQLEQMRREFVVGVSHEMKTPLCLLQMYAENLKYNVEGIDKDYYCDTIIDEAGRLSEMVGGMLELSSLENGLSAMDTRPLDLSLLCRETVERMAPVLERCRVRTALEEPCPVRGDPRFLEMAVKNFLSNAAAHTPEGGEVAVEVRREGATVTLTVANQGSRIPEERLAQVWDSFYKVDEARVRDGEVHAGLGLAIVKNVVARHGGTWRAENTRNGVAFSFTLPARED